MKGDPVGRCTACHQPRGWAQGKLAGEFTHPGTACSDCHNPHESPSGDFLVKPVAELCAGCHPQEARLAGGPHDPARRPEAWPDGTAEKGACLACHVAHGRKEKGLFRFPAPQGNATGDATCLVCHPDAAGDSGSEIAILHPLQAGDDLPDVDPKLLSSDGAGGKRIGCRTCHDPHGGARPGYLTRGKPDEPTALCLGCHPQKNLMRFTGHYMENLVRMGFDAGGCRPCHAMHANREKSWGQMLSPRFLVGKGASPGDEPSDGAACLVCHKADGPAPVPEVAAHPRIPNPNMTPPNSPGFLPLFDAAGHVSRDGQVACRTCHLSHGRLDLLQLAAQNQEMSEQDRRAMRLNLRAFIPPNICTQCHGEKARLKFLIFHDPVQREKNRPQ